MCVIMISETKRPSNEMVEKMFNDNPSGAGVAWREKGKVHWSKGLNVEEAKDLIAKVPLPFVAHFRIPSCGGATPYLCHPFPIDKGASVALEGSTSGYVLFHNGHWARWKDTLLEATVRGNVKIPTGKWSDSRAMALLASIHGLGVLEFIDEKIFVFGPDDHEIYGNGWSKVDDIWVSNKMWEGFGNQHMRGSNWRGPTGGRGGNHSCDSNSASSQKQLAAGSDEKKVNGSNSNSKEQKNTGKGSTGSTRESRGTSTEIPFVEAIKLRGEGKLSKKAFKRARNKYESMVRKGKMKRLPPEIWV